MYPKIMLIAPELVCNCFKHFLQSFVIKLFSNSEEFYQTETDELWKQPNVIRNIDANLQFITDHNIREFDF